MTEKNIYIAVDAGTEHQKRAANADLKLKEAEELEGLDELKAEALKGKSGIHLSAQPSKVTKVDDEELLKTFKEDSLLKTVTSSQKAPQFFYGSAASMAQDRLTPGDEGYLNGKSAYPLTEAQVQDPEFFKKAMLHAVEPFKDAMKKGSKVNVLLEVAPMLIYNSQTADAEDLHYDVMKMAKEAFGDIKNNINLRLLPQTAGTAVYEGLGAQGYSCVWDMGGGTDDVHIVHGQNLARVGEGELALFQIDGTNVCGRWEDAKLYEALLPLKERFQKEQNTKKGLVITPGTAKKINREYAFVGKNAHEDLKNYGFTVRGGKRQFYDIADIVKGVHESTIEDMAKVTNELAGHAAEAISQRNVDVDPDETYMKIMGNVVMSGWRAQKAGLQQELEKKLQEDYGDFCKVKVARIPLFAPAIGGLEYAMKLSPAAWGKQKQAQ